MSLLTLDSGWALIESESDRVEAERVSKMRESRRDELLALEKVKRERDSGKDWRPTYDRMLSTVPSEQRQYLEYPLLNDMLFSIINRVTKVR